MLDFFGSLRDKFWNWTGFYSKPFKTIYQNELPDSFEKSTIYVIGEKKHYWCIAMLCPCGCNAVIQLNLLPQVSPQWSFFRSRNATITISPSIWRNNGCKSHFYVSNGRIAWYRKYFTRKLFSRELKRPFGQTRPDEIANGAPKR
jgi:hypothetical protein